MLTYLLVENWKTRMNDTKVELDEFFTMWVHDSLNSVQNLDVSSIIGRFGVRKLLEIDIVSNLAKGASLSRVFCPCLIIRSEGQDLWVMFCG